MSFPVMPWFGATHSKRTSKELAARRPSPAQLGQHQPAGPQSPGNFAAIWGSNSKRFGTPTEPAARPPSPPNARVWKTRCGLGHPTSPTPASRPAVTPSDPRPVIRDTYEVVQDEVFQDTQLHQVPASQAVPRPPLSVIYDTRSHPARQRSRASTVIAWKRFGTPCDLGAIWDTGSDLGHPQSLAAWRSFSSRPRRRDGFSPQATRTQRFGTWFGDTRGLGTPIITPSHSHIERHNNELSDLGSNRGK